METEAKQQTLSASQIVHAVSRITDISVEDIKSKRRKRELVDCRKIAIALIYEHCGYSLNRTAKIFNLTNHATIIYSNHSYFDLLDTDKGFRDKVNKVKLLLGIS